jgi:hypothetical protein
MDKEGFLWLLKSNPILLSKVLEFNFPYNPELTLLKEDPTPLPASFNNLPSEFWHNYHKKLFLTEKAYGSPKLKFFWDFRPKNYRLALLDKDTLNSLATYFGTALYAPKIISVIKRDELKLLKASLGSYYEYAHGRARFQLGRLREELFTLFPETTSAVNMEAIQKIGSLSIYLAISEVPIVLQNKLSKFFDLMPGSFQDTFFNDIETDLKAKVSSFKPNTLKEWKNKLLNSMLKILFLEVSNKWRECFS